MKTKFWLLGTVLALTSCTVYDDPDITYDVDDDDYDDDDGVALRTTSHRRYVTYADTTPSTVYYTRPGIRRTYYRPSYWDSSPGYTTSRYYYRTPGAGAFVSY